MNAPKPHLAVIGSGYVGLTTAACLAHLGRNVTAIDIDRTKIDLLRQGELPILEQGLDQLVANGLDSGRLRFTTSYRAAAHASIVMLCLPTPLRDDGGLDLVFIEQAAKTLRQLLAPDAVVVTKSTVPVGTHRLLATWLDRADVHVAANPEFLREGSAVADFLKPDRIIIGAPHEGVANRVASLYDGIDAQIQVTDPTSAELIKYAANTFLATKLSFVNEVSRLCDNLGGNIAAVTDGLGSDHRIGKAFLQPGPGWGGSCFPKDTRGLTHLAKAANAHLPVAEAAHASNQIHLGHITAEIARLCRRPLKRARIGVWGATFKAGTNDTRDSPALEIISRLKAQGAQVSVYDPAADPATIAAHSVGDPYSACIEADMLVVLTEWPEFTDVDLDKVANTLWGQVIYDTRYVIDVAGATKVGIAVHQPGRPDPRP